MTKKVDNGNKKLLLIGIGFFAIFLFFFGLGSVDSPLNFTLNKAGVSDFYLQKETKVKKQVPIDSVAIKDSVLPDTNQVIVPINKTSANPIDIQIDTAETGERVLLLGDSQLEGLRNPVSAYCEANGHKLVCSVIWYGSSTLQWATTDTLEYYIKTFKPTVVLFAIGLNELFVRDLDKRKVYTQKIIQTFEAFNVKYAWIGPAAWTKDKGVIAVMEKEAGVHFYPSHLIKMQRASDNRHPSRNAAKLWFDQVAVALTEKKILDLSIKVDKLPKVKFKRTILLSLTPKA